MHHRTWPDSFSPSAVLAQLQHGIATLVKVVWQHLPEMLIAVSAMGLAYEAWNAWRQ
jgi:hypothetical protein